MNAAGLLAHYERIADSKDAITRLREFVLALGMEGKLVHQMPADEHAVILLNKITLVDARKNTFGPPQGGDQSTGLPHGWVRTSLGTVSNIVMGQSPPGSTYNAFGRGVPLINGPVEFSPGPFGKTVINQYTTAPTNFCEEGDLLICVRGSTTGRTNIAAFRACIGRGVAAIQPLIVPAFINLFVWHSRKLILSMGRGIAFPSVSRKQIEELPLKLPPLAEQHRIVAKVDELMALCDRLEAARLQRETTRDRLAAASLARLNTPDPETFQADARFAIGTALPALTARPDQIKQLRSTLRRLAFQGRFISADFSGPSGVELAQTLIRTSTPKARPRSANELSNSNFAAPLFDAPARWGWVSLQQICEQIGDIDHKMPRAVEVGVPFLSAKDLKDDGTLDFSCPKFISEEDFARLSRKILPRRGDIVYSRIGARLGKARMVESDIRFLISYSCCLIRPKTDFVDARFLQHFLDSDLALNQAHKGVQSIGVPDLGLGEIKAYRVPLPSLQEQSSIVTKVDELMGLCDQLETSLTRGENTRSRLLNALLHEALAPAERELEAA